jgi:hypothetical protein
MLKVAYIAMWRNGVVMATGMDTLATDIVAMAATGMDIVATDIAATMVILMVVITVGDTTTPTTTGLITEAIMATHMVATTADINY